MNTVELNTSERMLFALLRASLHQKDAEMLHALLKKGREMKESAGGH